MHKIFYVKFPKDTQLKVDFSKKFKNMKKEQIHTHPSFNIKMNWTMWTTLRRSYDSKSPTAFKNLVKHSNTIYFVNLKNKRNEFEYH